MDTLMTKHMPSGTPSIHSTTGRKHLAVLRGLALVGTAGSGASDSRNGKITRTLAKKKVRTGIPMSTPDPHRISSFPTISERGTGYNSGRRDRNRFNDVAALRGWL